MRLLKKIVNRLLAKRPYDYVKQARQAGVKVGNNCDIASSFWDAAEPYLITVGNNNQITKGVKIYTHGGGAYFTLYIPKL